jgi:hypothetical protein
MLLLPIVIRIKSIDRVKPSPYVRFIFKYEFQF